MSRSKLHERSITQVPLGVSRKKSTTSFSNCSRIPCWTQLLFSSFKRNARNKGNTIGKWRLVNTERSFVPRVLNAWSGVMARRRSRWLTSFSTTASGASSNIGSSLKNAKISLLSITAIWSSSLNARNEFHAAILSDSWSNVANKEWGSLKHGSSLVPSSFLAKLTRYLSVKKENYSWIHWTSDELCTVFIAPSFLLTLWQLFFFSWWPLP